MDSGDSVSKLIQSDVSLTERWKELIIEREHCLTITASVDSVRRRWSFGMDGVFRLAWAVTEGSFDPLSWITILSLAFRSSGVEPDVLTGGCFFFYSDAEFRSARCHRQCGGTTTI